LGDLIIWFPNLLTWNVSLYAKLDKYMFMYEFYSSWPIFHIIGNLDIFPLMCAAEKVWITDLTLIKRILGRFVTRMCKNWLILKIIG
jgi:hypothetical protein